MPVEKIHRIVFGLGSPAVIQEVRDIGNRSQRGVVVVAKNDRIGFAASLLNIIYIRTQSGFLQVGLNRKRRGITKFVVDLLGQRAVAVDTLLQHVGDGVDGMFFLRQIGVGVVIAVQPNGHGQQHDKQPEAAGDVAGVNGQLSILQHGYAFLKLASDRFGAGSDDQQ
ncbi:hypothetical protein D3C79_442660 [compost metagenome]